jgi:nitrogen fixation NifU-like protein
MSSNPALYNQIIIDHYHHPRHRGAISAPDRAITRSNESCGDTVHITIKVKNGVITDIKQEGDGCIISQAYASLLAEMALNKPAKNILTMDERAFISSTHMQLGPQRALCALLPLKALQEALQEDYAGSD